MTAGRQSLQVHRHIVGLQSADKLFGVVDGHERIGAAVEQVEGWRTRMHPRHRRCGSKGFRNFRDAPTQELWHQLAPGVLAQIHGRAAGDHYSRTRLGTAPGSVQVVPGACRQRHQAQQVGTCRIAKCGNTLCIQLQFRRLAVQPVHGLLQVVNLGGVFCPGGKTVTGVQHHISLANVVARQARHVIAAAPLPAATVHQQHPGERAATLGAVNIGLQRLGPVWRCVDDRVYRGGGLFLPQHYATARHCE